jgi:predicted nucleic acid-binding protein
MRALYVDTSCLVALEFGEPGGADVGPLLASVDTLFSSAVLEAEVRSACARERVPVPTTRLAALSWILPPRRLSPELDRVFAASLLKGADAWHIACALFLDPSARDLGFVTLDERQSEAARAVGFTVLPAPSRRRPRGVR